MSPRSATVYSDTTAYTNLEGVFAFQVLADAVFTSASGGLAGTAGITFPAGTVVYCNLSAFTLASGQIIVYRV